MKLICVDDEQLVLQLTMHMCQQVPQVHEVTGFLRASEALAWLDDHMADIALLDINMPEMDGIALAARMKAKAPHLVILFLTGYADYAVEAFALHASGYLLKPISQERLQSEITYVLSEHKRLRPAPHIEVKSFGNFDVIVDGETICFTRAKAKELLAYLIDRQGSSITRAEAFALLWEEGIYDRKMQKQLDVIIRSLRDTLKDYGISEILEMKRGALRIVPELLECDLYRFLDGDIDAINAYRGEYMSSYSWAGITEAYMDRKNIHKED